jgi:hypothetical protein
MVRDFTLKAQLTTTFAEFSSRDQFYFAHNFSVASESMTLPNPAHNKLHDIAENWPEQREDRHDCRYDFSRLRRGFALDVPHMLAAKSAFAGRAIAPLSGRAEIKARTVSSLPRSRRRDGRRVLRQILPPRPFQGSKIPGVVWPFLAVLFSINL